MIFKHFLLDIFNCIFVIHWPLQISDGKISWDFRLVCYPKYMPFAFLYCFLIIIIFPPDLKCTSHTPEM